MRIEMQPPRLKNPCPRNRDHLSQVVHQEHEQIFNVTISRALYKFLKGGSITSCNPSKGGSSSLYSWSYGINIGIILVATAVSFPILTDII